MDPSWGMEQYEAISEKYGIELIEQFEISCLQKNKKHAWYCMVRYKQIYVKCTVKIGSSRSRGGEVDVQIDEPKARQPSWGGSKVTIECVKTVLFNVFNIFWVEIQSF